MGFYVIFGTLAAFGLLCIIWTVFGVFHRGCSPDIILYCGGQTPNIGALLLLRELGVLRGRFFLVDCGNFVPVTRPYICCCTKEELLQLLSQEAN